MREISFRATPKGDIPHYWFIFRNPDSLRTELKNDSCSRSEIMLYLEIQKGMEGMKAS